MQKARRASRLVVYSDGSINAASSDMCRAEMTDRHQQRRSAGGEAGFPSLLTIAKQMNKLDKSGRKLAVPPKVGDSGVVKPD